MTDSVTGILSTTAITEPPWVECQNLLIPHRSMHASWGLEPRFIVFSKGLGLHKMLPPSVFKPGTSRMPGICRTTVTHLPLIMISWPDLIFQFSTNNCAPVNLNKTEYKFSQLHRPLFLLLMYYIDCKEIFLSPFNPILNLWCTFYKNSSDLKLWNIYKVSQIRGPSLHRRIYKTRLQNYRTFFKWALQQKRCAILQIVFFVFESTIIQL